MQDRRALEARLGQTKDSANPPPELKALNQKFGALHGASVLLNLAWTILDLFAVARIGAHGL